MSADGILTLTCPHCSRLLRAMAEHAGRRVRCPHAECRQPVPVPFALDAEYEENEPDEPVLLPEDPANPQQVPLAVAPAPAPIPEPQQKPRDENEDEPPARPAVLLWALAVVAFAVAFGAGAALVLTTTRAADSNSAAALEARNRELQAENQALREKLGAATRVAPAPKEPSAHEISYTGFLNLIDAGQLKSVTLFGNDRAEGAVRDPNHELAQEQRLGPRGLFVVHLPNTSDPRVLVQRIEQADQWVRAHQTSLNLPVPEPVVISRRDGSGNKIGPGAPAKPPEGRAAFLGTWAVTGAELQKNGSELSVEFRADGTCVLNVRTGGRNRELFGTWRWERQRLHMSSNGMPGTPSEVTWNGPDEFVSTADNMPFTFRRKF